MYFRPVLVAATDSPTEIVKLVLGSMIWAELIGVPVAWLHLRRSDAWLNRSAEAKRLDLLARYVGKVTGMVGIWSLAVLLGAILGWAAS